MSYESDFPEIMRSIEPKFSCDRETYDRVAARLAEGQQILIELDGQGHERASVLIESLDQVELLPDTSTDPDPEAWPPWSPAPGSWSHYVYARGGVEPA